MTALEQFYLSIPKTKKHWNKHVKGFKKYFLYFSDATLKKPI